jgi:hypothetical protein
MDMPTKCRDIASDAYHEEYFNLGDACYLAAEAAEQV